MCLHSSTAPSRPSSGAAAWMRPGLCEAMLRGAPLAPSHAPAMRAADWLGQVS